MEKDRTDKLNGEILSDELQTFLSEYSAAPSDADDDGLPFETPDDFSTDPVRFEEMAEVMLAQTEDVFDLSVIYNRHSKKYLKACALLEKGIKYLGSACLTKSALETGGYSCPNLGQLSTLKLYGMASRNFRKLDRALKEKKQQQNDLYPEWTDMFFRYYNLLQRLRSTDAKILEYHHNRYSDSPDYSPEAAGRAFTEKRWTKNCPAAEPSEPPVFHRAPAFPILKGMGGPAAEASAPARLPAPQTETVPAAGAASFPEAPEALPAPAEPEENPAETKPARDPDALITEEEMDECLAILETVRKRSSEAGEKGMTFYDSEAMTLLDNLYFRTAYPDLAEQLSGMVNSS